MRVDSGARTAWRALVGAIFRLDEPKAAIGQDLNLYAAFNKRIAPAWLGNRERRARRHLLTEPVPIFDFDPDVPLSEIRRLKTECRGKGRRKTTRLMTLETGDTMVSLASIVLGFLWPPIAGLAAAVRPIVERARTVPGIDAMIDRIG